MNNIELKNIWAKHYECVSEQLKKMKEIPSVATGFNTNIDAIIKISGNRIKELLEENSISINELQSNNLTKCFKPNDILLGIVKCFSRGIAEEWVTEDINIYKWLETNLGYQRLQMGGQGGIIANALALLGIKEVIAHTNSHPALQAAQFLDLDNLLAINENGHLEKAHSIAREDDMPLIHWIIEFDKDDSFTYEGQEFKCPKSNRFIATYDPLNMKLVMNKYFVDYIRNNKISYLLLSGFHPLLKEKDGLNLIDNAVSVLKSWKKAQPEMIIHLEIASTQDKEIRSAIINKIAPLADSAGLNERETIDLLEVMNNQSLAEKIEKETSAPNLYQALLFLKKELNIPRIQLHMFGLYLTIQDKRFPYSSQQNLRGMMTAATVSSAKAFVGALEKYEDIKATMDRPVSDVGLKELENLSQMLNKPELMETGLCEIDDYQISAIPTILIDKPKTLVGMGDTISSISLLAGR